VCIHSNAATVIAKGRSANGFRMAKTVKIRWTATG